MTLDSELQKPVIIITCITVTCLHVGPSVDEFDSFGDAIALLASRDLAG